MRWNKPFDFTQILQIATLKGSSWTACIAYHFVSLLTSIHVNPVSSYCTIVYIGFLAVFAG